MAEEKTQAQRLRERLAMKPKNTGLLFPEAEVRQAYEYCEPYKAFLTGAKMEREAVAFAVAQAEKHGFVPFDGAKKVAKGDKIYYNNRGKAAIFAVVGEKPLSEGVHIAAAHIDSPRLDLKQRPLYEESELAEFKTHYYGGIKKYQWTAVPLALHGVVAKKDGTKVEVRLGEDEGDPQFCVTDLLPHLAADQMKKTMNEAFTGEDLNVIVGSLPFRDDKESELVKLHVLQLLSEKYGIDEADFLSAELAMVPAGRAVDVGFDRSMVGSYGHDDRVCAYTAFTALLDVGVPETTAVCVLTDKEEIGSDGNTGLSSSYLEYFIADLARQQGLAARDVLRRSKCLSADVSAAFDPTYPGVMEKNNAAYLNRGVAVNKYTGSHGKYGTSDATAEFTAWTRALLDGAGVPWQMAELGKVDQGGGGTVAMFIAKLDVDTIDVGVPVLSMHAPFELVSKLDVYAAYKAFAAFYRA